MIRKDLRANWISSLHYGCEIHRCKEAQKGFAVDKASRFFFCNLFIPQIELINIALLDIACPKLPEMVANKNMANIWQSKGF